MKPDKHNNCPQCGRSFCQGYRIEGSRTYCWIWSEDKLEERSRRPRNSEAVDNRYNALRKYIVGEELSCDFPMGKKPPWLEQFVAVSG
jgi:hypothetical protein